MIIDRFLFKIRGVKKGDVVICKSPVKYDIDICKRVAYLENECKNKNKLKIY